MIDRMKNEKGQAIVELSIILPIILLLVMVIIYAGIFTFSKSIVLLSAHEGGRQSLLIWNYAEYTQDQKKQMIEQAISNGLSGLPNASNSEIVVDDTEDGIIHIHVTYHFQISLPFMAGIFGSGGVPLHSDVVYRYAIAPNGGT